MHFGNGAPCLVERDACNFGYAFVCLNVLLCKRARMQGLLLGHVSSQYPLLTIATLSFALAINRV